MESKSKRISALMPWTAGAGFATGHMMLTSQCTIVTLGICTGCAGCAVALVSLVGWGAFKEKPPKSVIQGRDE
ncbi:MAG: hypothetical protein ABW170_19020 [Candidatus Thiodiazotropha sp. L084R]